MEKVEGKTLNHYMKHGKLSSKIMHMNLNVEKNKKYEASYKTIQNNREIIKNVCQNVDMI